MMQSSIDIAVIGAGPAGLFAAENLSARGHSVAVYDRMPTPGRKFLMAGRGGLNLTHSEPLEPFLDRYRPRHRPLIDAIRAFPPGDLRQWCEELGEETFVGSSGRVFPKAMKASPLLRAWRSRLEGQGVRLFLRHEWTGWDDEGALSFGTQDGSMSVQVRATILALGGASWPRLGSDGGWTTLLTDNGSDIAPFEPANGGFKVDWSPLVHERFAGTPLKHVTISLGDHFATGDAMIAKYGIEGGAIYALSSFIREALKSGPVELRVDFRPGVTESALAERVATARKGESMSNRLRKRAGLSPVSAALLREPGPLSNDAKVIAARIKNCPVVVTGDAGLERAISSAGGLRFDTLDEAFMVKAQPGVFACGEMLDWEAPTGGYLLQACFATGLAAAKGADAWLNRSA